MNRSVKRWTIGVAGGLAATTALAIGAVVAFACIPIAMLNLSPNTVSPGQTVTASIQAIAVSSPGADAPPVVFHWQTLDGPTLATATPGLYGTTATFTVPTSVSQSGDYLVIATQAPVKGSSTWGLPARAVLHVAVNGQAPAGSSGAATAGSSNSAGLATSSAIGPGILALIAIGVTALAVSLVGLTIWGVDRVSPRAQTVGRR